MKLTDSSRSTEDGSSQLDRTPSLASLPLPQGPRASLVASLALLAVTPFGASCSYASEDSARGIEEPPIGRSSIELEDHVASPPEKSEGEAESPLSVVAANDSTSTSRIPVPTTAEVEALVKRLREPNVAEVSVAVAQLLEALKDAGPDVRLKVAQDLGEFKDPAAVAALIAMLTDEDREVSHTASASLARIGDLAAVPALIDSARRNYDYWSQVSVLASFGTPAVPILLAEAQNPNRAVRKTIMGALGEIKDPLALPALIEAVGDKEAFMRASALYALRNFKGELAFNAACAALQDEDVCVRRAAAWNLSWSIWENIDHEIDEAPKTAIVRALDDSDWEVRNCSLRFLLGSRDPELVPKFMDLVPKHSLAIVALGEIGPAAIASVDLVKKHLYLGGIEERKYALNALYQIAPAEWAKIPEAERDRIMRQSVGRRNCALKGPCYTSDEKSGER